ncbi:MAG: polymer-forming cytoskeletal protein, partial [Prosthecobacter sp.]|nr:polymer-forming cytoskeletal protein [Prosthecobacter sp.]
VVCPACGAAPYEPRLVVSSFCKKCGVHLTMDRKKVSASSVTRSTIPPRESREQEPAPVTVLPKITSSIAPTAKHNGNHPPPESAEPVTPEEAEEGGFGAFLKQQTAAAPPAAISAPPSPPKESASDELLIEIPATPPPQPADPPATTTTVSPLARVVQRSQAIVSPSVPSEAAAELSDDLFAEPKPAVARRPQSNSPPPTATPTPMSASTLQKMKDQGMYRNQYFKDAECFECPHKFKVSRSSRSASCPACGASIAMEDIEINMPSNQAIKTRGDVLIRKRGHLSGDRVVCKDFRCYGTLEADVAATGDAVFRSTGTVTGNVRCRRLIIEKGCDVTFQHPVHADEVEVHARVTGTLVSKGLVLIGVNGCANGDVTARSVSIEPGGELNGTMNIVRGPNAKPKPAAVQEEPSPPQSPS